MNVYLPNLRLPSTYQEVEYIESSGTQYINTGYIPSNNTKIEMSMGGWNTVQQFQNLFGAREAFSSTGKGFHLGYNTQYMYYAMFGKAVDIQTSVLSFINGSNYIIQMSKDGIYQNGTLKYTFSSATFTSPVNLTLFALNDNGTVTEQGAFKMYYTKIWDNGTLVRNFIPCYRKSDGVIGLYDLVNSVFYTNAGTGTFSKGNDVTMAVLKNAYIGEVWTPNANTIAYYPLTSTSTVNDMSGNNRNLTNSGATFGTYQGVDSGYINGYMYYTGISTPSNITINIWYNLRTKSDDYYYLMAGLKYGSSNSNVYGFLMAGEFGGRPNGQGFGVQWNNSSSSGQYYGLVNGTKSTIGTWYNGVITYDGATMKIYLNGTLANSTNVSMTNARDTIFFGYNSSASKLNLSNAIFEDRLWTATEILNYYNNTKSNYGL